MLAPMLATCSPALAKSCSNASARASLGQRQVGSTRVGTLTARAKRTGLGGGEGRVRLSSRWQASRAHTCGQASNIRLAGLGGGSLRRLAGDLADLSRA